MSSTPADRREPFVHPALLYAGADEYRAGTVPFVRAALEAGEPVLVAVPPDNGEIIRTALGRDAARVQIHDMTVAGRNPGRILPHVLLAFARRHAGRPVRIIGEPIWAGRSAVEYPACVQHEALINVAFANRDATILCPYDVRRLDPAWLDDAYRTHPEVWTADDRHESPGYGDPAGTASTFNRWLPGPPGDAPTIAVTRGSLTAVRAFVAVHAAAAGLPAAKVADIVLAVNEIAANTVRHSGGDGALALWTENGQLICQLTDPGHIDDPMAGRVPVPPDQLTGGRGLVMVNHLTDLVRIFTRPGATTIQLHMNRFG